MAQVKAQKIPDVSSAERRKSSSATVLTDEEKERWDKFVEFEDEIEEEESISEPSYEIFEPPPPEERDIGTIIRDCYGFYKNIDLNVEELDLQNDEIVYRYTLSNANGISIQVVTLGAAVISIRMPDNKNIINDVTLGLNNLEDYLSERNNLFFGSILGRFNSIISNGSIKLNKDAYQLSTNFLDTHHDKGGFRGFDKAIWQSYVAYDRVIMTYVSTHLEEGYPGNLMVQISFHLTKNNCLVIKTTAETSLPTILSIGHHIYFNLGGHEAGPGGIKEHIMQVNAEKYIKVDGQKVPTGEIENVGATYFDLRVPRPISKIISLFPAGGYDHVFCLTTEYTKDEELTSACRLIHPPSGRFLEIRTDMPGLYINTGSRLPNTDALPPLEAQVGFKEEFYPKFCKEEKEKEIRVKKLQAEMAAKQTWLPQESISEMSDIDLSIPIEPPVIEKKVLFEISKHSVGKDKKEDLPRKVDKDLDEKKTKSQLFKEQEKQYSELHDASEEDSDIYYPEISQKHKLQDLKFLKDTAVHGVGEHAVFKWSPPQPVIGRRGVPYRLNGGICLMTQEYPDSMRHKNFPKPVITPGQKFSRTTVYKFGIIYPKPPHAKLKFAL